MNATIHKIAKLNGIPSHHVINGYHFLHSPKFKGRGISRDTIHPNEQGFKDLAKEFFSHMAHSPQFLYRQKQILENKNPNFIGLSQIDEELQKEWEEQEKNLHFQ